MYAWFHWRIYFGVNDYGEFYLFLGKKMFLEKMYHGFNLNNQICFWYEWKTHKQKTVKCNKCKQISVRTHLHR